MAFPAQRLAAPRTITSADALRLARFPAIRREFSDALAQQPVAAEVTPSYVRFRLKNPAAFHPALFAVIRVGGKGTMIVIGTPKAKIRQPAALASFLHRMGWNGGRWTRALNTMERRGLMYQLRKANIIGGSETQAVLVPRQRVESAAGKFMRGSTRATGTNPDDLSRLKRDRDRVVRVMERPMSPRVFQQLMAEVERLNRGIRRLEGRPVNVARNPRVKYTDRYYLKVGDEYIASMWGPKGLRWGLVDKKRAGVFTESEAGAVIGTLRNSEVLRGRNVAMVPAPTALHRAKHPLRNPLNDRESASLLRYARSAWRAREGEQNEVKRIFHAGKATGEALSVIRFGKSERARRLAARFVISHAHTTMGNPRTRKNPLTRKEAGQVLRSARRLARRSRDKAYSPTQRAHYAGSAGGQALVARQYGPRRALRPSMIIGMRSLGFKAKEYREELDSPAKRSRPRRNAPRKNPILATLGIAANPNPAVQNINIPFRDGQKVTTDRIERWIRSLPNGPLRTMYETRFVLGQKQYKRFHLGTVPKTWTWKTVPVGANKRITDVDFVVSEGKEWSAAYQVPPHSKKYTKDTQGRYLHAHGDSGIDIKTIKHPAKPSKLPERFHTADGLFVGVIPKKGSITDWYRH